jgi:hypothetical protein
MLFRPFTIPRAQHARACVRCLHVPRPPEHRSEGSLQRLEDRSIWLMVNEAPAPAHRGFHQPERFLPIALQQSDARQIHEVLWSLRLPSPELLELAGRILDELARSLLLAGLLEDPGESDRTTVYSISWLSASSAGRRHFWATRTAVDSRTKPCRQSNACGVLTTRWTGSRSFRRRSSMSPFDWRHSPALR